jgi:chromosome partitioning protein
MISIAVYNLKGGVGKTATAVNLAYLSANDGYRTLLWDLDPQASTTFYYQIKPKVKGGMKSLIGKDFDMVEAIMDSGYEGLDIIPADLSIRNMDIVLDEHKSSKKRIKSSLSQLEKDYDIVFIDSPPGFSLLSENIFNAADFILMPMIPTTLSVRTYDIVLDYFNQTGLDKDKLIPFFSMYDGRKNMHNEIVDEFTRKRKTLRTVIPYSSDVERMGITQAPLVSYSSATRAAMAYNELWKELKRKIK